MKSSLDKKSIAEDLAIVISTETAELASNYEQLLKRNDIPTMTKEISNPDQINHNHAVIVPEEYIDEAYVIIESQEDYDDFYDFALEIEDDENDF